MNAFWWFMTGVLVQSSVILVVMYAQGLMNAAPTGSQRALTGVGAFGMVLVAAVQATDGRWPFGGGLAAVAGAYGLWAAAPRLPFRHRAGRGESVDRTPASS